MTEPLTAATLQDHIDHRPQVVLDAYGNLWRYYNDVGWLLLMVAPRMVEPARPTLAALNEYVGPVRKVTLPNGR